MCVCVCVCVCMCVCVCRLFVCDPAADVKGPAVETGRGVRGGGGGHCANLVGTALSGDELI